MTDEILLENSQTPVTAVSYNSGILLAADGPILRLWDEIKRIPLKSHRIFRSQQIHGIAISGSRALPEQAIVWGGKLLRIVNLDGFTSSELASIEQNKDLLELSGPILESPDWILDISVRPVETESCLAQDIKAVAITAHNDLLALNDSGGIRTLAAGSQCILYSAHLTWISPERLLIGSGSAFGEIIVWTYSWEDCGPIARTHHVFTGHEGSIFGIRISKPLINSTGQNIRVLSSCSDDRTIRVWDISDLSEQINEKDTIDHDTGFSPNPMVSMDQLHNHRCLASAMGHASRIWSLRYIYPPRSSVDDVPPVVRILSVGEDATCQTWDLVETHSRPSHDRVAYELRHADSALCHSGKHIWAIHVPSQAIGTECFQAISGGADGRIVTRRVLANKSRGAFVASQEWDSRDISGSPPQSTDLGSTVSKDGSISKIPRGDDRECFRGLTFVGSNQILTILNSGLVYLSSSRKEETRVLSVSSWQKLGDFPGLRGYSVSAATLDGHFAFFAGSTGTVYCYDHQSGTASQISKIDGKVAALFAQSTPPGTKYSGSLVTAYLGRNMAQIALFRRGVSGKLESFGECTIDSLTSPVTSAAFVDGKQNLLILGCRNGSISVFVAPIPPGEDQLEATFFSLKHTIEMAHGKETVTNVRWIPGYSEDLESLGSILSVGRDGTCCIHAINKELESSLVHKLSLPFGPNIEGLWINLNTSELFVYGFQGTKFLLYNITAFQEVLSINCGGAHRTWSFRPIINSSDTGKIGGSFAWTQASKLKASFISEPSYEIIQSGGHGREIKACAVAPVALPRSTTGPLIATGAEDTDIRLFKYTKGGTKGFTAVATLRKHDSGIQNLKWSSDGRYLFSSGGHLEFFIWRLEAVAILGIGVVCESVCPVEKRLSELRITAFEIEDMTALDDSLDGASETRANFLITLVYCNSIVKTFRYTSHRGVGHWTILGTGIYTSACLTQAAYLSINTTRFLLTASTDGHLAIWDMPDPQNMVRIDNACREQGKSNLGMEQSILCIKSLHQNSIKSCSLVKLSKDAFLVSTGGDDNAIGLSLIRFEDGDHKVSVMSIESAIVPNAHAAAIGALSLVPFGHDNGGLDGQSGYNLRLVSSGNDQRVKLWDVHLDSLSTGMGGVGVRRISNEATSVADVSDLAIMPQSGNFDITDVAICGVGMEMWRVKSRDISLRQSS